MKQYFIKACLTPQQHVTLLNSRGLSISDEYKAISYVTNIGYFRLIRYFPFTVSSNNSFKDKLKALLAVYPIIDTGAMGFSASWENEDIWKK